MVYVRPLESDSHRFQVAGQRNYWHQFVILNHHALISFMACWWFAHRTVDILSFAAWCCCSQKPLCQQVAYWSQIPHILPRLQKNCVSHWWKPIFLALDLRCWIYCYFSRSHMILELKQPLFLFRDLHFAYPEFLFEAHLIFLVSDLRLPDFMSSQFLAWTTQDLYYWN